MSHEKYSQLFPESKRKEALRVALDVRKFEIELYWKRAAYFWTFIAATFVGYNTVKDDFMQLTLSCFGVFLSLAWVLANRGSKQWQENWEHHVDHLEDKEIGPLYKTTLPRSTPSGFLGWLDYLAVGPSGHSVSKINQLISLFVHALWWIILCKSFSKIGLTEMSAFEVSVLVLTAVGLAGLALGSRTYGGSYGHKLKVRESNFE